MSDPWLKLRDRFERFILPEPMSGCWLWTGGVDGDGYGIFWRGADVEPQQIRAPRAAWELYRGPIAGGLFVLHRCDQPCCVNPDHLFLGSHADNMADRSRKGRTALCGSPGAANGTATKPESILRGSQVPHAKLTEARVRAIRADTRPLASIAKENGVSIAAVSMARNGRTWRHVR